MLRLMVATRRNVSGLRISSTLFASRTTSTKATAPVPKEMLLYVGPPSMKPAYNILTGLVFFVAGGNIAYTLYNHMVWPILSRDKERKPELCSLTKRRIAASVSMMTFTGLSTLFFIKPCRSITRIVLRPAERTLVIRTAHAGLGGFLPSWILPSPFKRNLQRIGYYCTPVRQERVVPLDGVFRHVGAAAEGESASSAGSTRLYSLSLKLPATTFFYELESAGGYPPTLMANLPLLSRISKKLVHTWRAKADWSGIPESELPKGAKKAEPRQRATHGSKWFEAREREGRILGPKEPWFFDRRNFDRLIPLQQRK